MASFERTKEFYLQDHPRTLFPLGTTKFLIENFSSELGDFVYGKITHEKESSYAFLPQTKVYASKPGFHLRRTAKLDPVAEFFIYDLIYRNRNSFRKSGKQSRTNFGYRFETGRPISPANSYRAFKQAVHASLTEYKYCAKFDISTYFNSIYHHDLVMWFNNMATTEADAQFFDKFLKQTNSGRSVDCLPHGIYPTKMIGSHYLNFVDYAARLDSENMLRFMDDFYLFSDDLDLLVSDFIEAQRLLGERGLSLNPLKTVLGEIEHIDIEKEIDDIKLSLLTRRGRAITASGTDEGDWENEFEDDDVDEDILNEEETEYLFSMLRYEQIEEEDAELILSLMRDHGNDVLEHIPVFLDRFPNLSKNIFHFCAYVDDKEELGNVVIEYLSNNNQVTEYQLFWFSCLLEVELFETKSADALIPLLYEHHNSTDVTKARILEIPNKRYGLDDMREEQLRTGASVWPAWSSAVGSRVERKSNRNHLLGYFANGSSMNELIADCVKKYE